MLLPYDKPYKSIPEQIALLQSRGMLIHDVAKASFYLQRLGYYRLSGYWYAFRKRSPGSYPEDPPIILDEFQPGTEFKHVMDLYVFDKKLRMLLLDSIERIEVAVRVEVALLIGARNRWAHREPAELHGDFTRVKMGYTCSKHEEWLRRVDDQVARSKEEFVAHFRETYTGPLPIWIAIEAWDFGILSTFVNGMKWNDKLALTLKFGLPRPDFLTSWLRSLNHVRNICAHHSRLWNRPLTDYPKPPRAGELTLHDHWAVDRHAQTRVYGIAAVLQHFMRFVSPSSSWAHRFKQLISTFPATPGVSIRNAGFPAGWEFLALWC